MPVLPPDLYTFKLLEIQKHPKNAKKIEPIPPLWTPLRIPPVLGPGTELNPPPFRDLDFQLRGVYVFLYSVGNDPRPLVKRVLPLLWIINHMSLCWKNHCTHPLLPLPPSPVG